MGKTGKWIRNFLTGKKDDKEKESKNIASNDQQIISASYVNKHQYHPTTPLTIPPATGPKEKRRRWSFCGRPDSISGERIIAMATIARFGCASELAAVKIQSVFRAHLAKRALKALKGLVKLQALARGHLVRKQAAGTLKCMESLMTAQTRARAKRLQSTQKNLKHVTRGKSAHEDKLIRGLNQDMYISPQENVKILDVNPDNYRPTIAKFSSSYLNYTQFDFNKPEHIKVSTQISPPSSLSAITTDHISPRTCSHHFERYSFSPAKIGSFTYTRSEYGESFYNGYRNQLHLYPNYMADTKSSRAKLRSNSAPKQRPVEALGGQTSRRRSSCL